jgi:hypothetical protein
MEKKDLEGKSIGEILDDNTSILGRLTPAEVERIKNQELKSFGIVKGENVAVLQNWSGMNCLIVFAAGVPVAMFYIYELHGVHINEERGFVLAYGHENILLFWFDNGELTEITTR